jgi:hypothetical protein
MGTDGGSGGNNGGGGGGGSGNPHDDDDFDPNPNCVGCEIGGGGECGNAGIYDCPPVVSSNYPDSIILHPLDGNVVSQVPIYDYSFYPPRLIGYTTTSYVYDDFHVSPADYYLPSDAITWTSFLRTRVGPILQGGFANLASVGIELTCTACGITLTVIATIDSLNSAITIDTHLETHDIYFSQPPIVTPLDNPQYRFP